VLGYFFPEHRVVTEILSKNLVQPEAADIVAPVAYWTSKTTRFQKHIRAYSPTSTHTRARTHKYLILIAFPRQQWFRERVLVLRYTYSACLVQLFSVNETEYNLGKAAAIGDSQDGDEN
jgi:hypothetical protein